MFIARDLEGPIEKGLESGKVVVLFGARQTGKTTPRCHFWRNTAQAEIAWVEESAERGIRAYEFKWRNGARAKCPEAFARAYPEATWTCVTRENYDAFVCGEI